MQAVRNIRLLTLSVAVLVLWCTALDGVLHAGYSAMLSDAGGGTFAALAAPVSPPPESSHLTCCENSNGNDVWSVPPAASPVLSAPLSAVLNSARPSAGDQQLMAPIFRRLPAHRASLFQQAVLIRI